MDTVIRSIFGNDIGGRVLEYYNANLKRTMHKELKKIMYLVEWNCSKNFSAKEMDKICQPIRDIFIAERARMGIQPTGRIMRTRGDKVFYIMSWRGCYRSIDEELREYLALTSIRFLYT